MVHLLSASTRFKFTSTINCYHVIVIDMSLQEFFSFVEGLVCDGKLGVKS